MAVGTRMGMLNQANIPIIVKIGIRLVIKLINKIDLLRNMMVKTKQIKNSAMPSELDRDLTR